MEFFISFSLRDSVRSTVYGHHLCPPREYASLLFRSPGPALWMKALETLTSLATHIYHPEIIALTFPVGFFSSELYARSALHYCKSRPSALGLGLFLLSFVFLWLRRGRPETLKVSFLETA